MRILTNTTSPYARIARIALAEKDFDLGGTQIVNPMEDGTSDWLSEALTSGSSSSLAGLVASTESRLICAPLS